MVIDVPAGLDRDRALGPDWATWLDRLPGLARSLLADWGLERDATRSVWKLRSAHDPGRNPS